jgi:lysophospholipase L1-like esterase
MRARFFCSRTWLALAIGAVLNLPLFARVTAETKPPPEAQWEKDILAFEAADKASPPPQNAILFIGSSSIRLWTNLAQAFPGHQLLNRGFGGSHLSDSVAFVDRIVIPYKPKLVLLYAGDNDIAAGKSPVQVLRDFKAFVGRIRAALPDTRIAYIAIKPCPARQQFLDRVKTTNLLIQNYTASDKRLLFVDVFTPMLTKEGRPRADLCLNDGLHPNPQCYELWATILKPILDKYDPPKNGAQHP